MADSEALRDYLPAFEGERGSDHFLTYYSIAPDKTLRTRRYTREQFYSLALRAASVLAEVGLTAGQMHTHFFSGNTVGDLAFRLGAVMMGTVPITINWQADTPERVVHKVKTTGSRLVLTDGETPADVVAKVRAECSCVERVFDVSELSSHPVTFDVSSKFCTQLPVSAESTRIVIFTSGTTGDPKGVRLSYRSYRCNRHTFESFLQAGDGKKLVGVVVNPMHHTNSTSITDWALRKPRAELHLLQRYTTSYWSVLARAGTRLPIDALVDETELTAAIEDRHKPPPDAGGGGAAAGYSSGLDVVVVAPLVSRHFDFLDGLLSSGTLPLPAASLKAAMSRSILLLGSAPVGPTTVERLQKYAGKLPTVRFGSTETCLQVMGTPLYLSESERLDAFAAGWAHKYGGEPQVGYYIGRPHPPFTECRVVRSVEAGADGYMVDSDEGEPGQLITRGENIMTGYVGNEASTAKAIHDGGWYVNLGDVVFRLRSKADGGDDFFWLSRDSALLIRGGANYSYEQINAELAAFVTSHYGLADDAAAVAVVGLRLTSEHEDECCVTLDLLTDQAKAKAAEIEASFLKACKTGVSKGAKPDRLRLGPLPRNFKGIVLVPELKKEWLQWAAEHK